MGMKNEKEANTPSTMTKRIQTPLMMTISALCVEQFANSMTEVCFCFVFLSIAWFNSFQRHSLTDTLLSVVTFIQSVQDSRFFIVIYTWRDTILWTAFRRDEKE